MYTKMFFTACIVGLVAGGCRATTVVLGNLTTMFIVVVMFWSTLRLEGR